MRAYNFCAGPAALPESVILKAQAELPDWQNHGAAIFEISHRAPAVKALIDTAKHNVKTLLSVPDDYDILFMHGGANGQFFSVPMNLFGKQAKAAYLDTGLWSQKAMNEAKKYGDVQCIASLDMTNKPWAIPEPSTWHVPDECAYVHYTDNETISGVQFDAVPEVGNMPLVTDMTSSLFSRRLDISKFGIIYAGFQKNMGIAGAALVIIRKDLLDQALPITPSIYHYQTQVKANSAYNTLPTFNIYLSNLIFEWMLSQGGLGHFEVENTHKAEKVYAVIDQYECYQNTVAPKYRSTMNATFFLPNEALEKAFLEGAKAHHLINLKGHRSLGGVRVSLYNAVTEQAVDALVAYMHEFAQTISSCA